MYFSRGVNINGRMGLDHASLEVSNSEADVRRLNPSATGPNLL